MIKEAKDKNICTSLAVFKPTKIHKFTYEKTDREWDSKKINFVESEKRQLNLFESENEEDIENFEVVDKLPYKFKYEFEDDSGKIANLMIEDWETGMLYWNSLKSESCNGDEMKACEKVKEKYFDNFVKTKDVYFYLGTTKQHHYTAPNPFVIIGAFYPKSWKAAGPQASIDGKTRGKFLDISNNTPDGKLKEQMLISYYASNGTIKEDADKFPRLVKETNETLTKLIPNYQMVSEGNTLVNGGWNAYEVRFQGSGTGEKGERLLVWGRRIFVPAARPGVRSGFEITMSAKVGGNCTPRHDLG